MPMTKWKLRRLAKRASPDRATHKAMRQALQHAGYLPKQPVWMPAHTSISARSMAVLSSVVVISLVSATGSYAYVADEVVPDHPLYTVRQTIERAELSFATSVEAKARVNQRLEERRAREAAVLEKKRKATETKEPLNVSAMIASKNSATTTAEIRVANKEQKKQEQKQKKENRRTEQTLRQQLKESFKAVPSLKQILTATTSRRFIERSSTSTRAQRVERLLNILGN